MTNYNSPERVTSPFGPRTINGVWQHHNGKDKVPTSNDWNVREVTGGIVIETSIGYNYGRGNLVRVQCGNAVETYQHLNEIYVKKGQTVKQGDVIGLTGWTGDCVPQGPGGRHLHFEVTIGGKAVDPSPWDGQPNAKGTYPCNDDLDTGGTLQPTQAPTVGSIVSFAGGSVYGASAATKAIVTRPASKCKITIIADGHAHPYHCISEDGKGVYGWVDAVAIGAAPVEKAKMYNVTAGPMTEGDKNTLEAEAKRLGLSVSVTEAG